MDVVISAQVIPTFTQIGPLCQNSTAPALPATSNNGFAGTWNPATISTATVGTTTYTFTPSDPCATTTTIDITVIPTATSTTTITICSDQLPYIWNGNNYSSGGIYNVTLTSAAGCDSIATLNLAVVAEVTPT